MNRGVRSPVGGVAPDICIPSMYVQCNSDAGTKTLIPLIRAVGHAIQLQIACAPWSPPDPVFMSGTSTTRTAGRLWVQLAPL